MGLSPVCSGSHGHPYDGAHRVGPSDGYTVVEPGGAVRRSCDSNCLRGHSRQRLEEFLARLRADAKGMAS